MSYSEGDAYQQGVVSNCCWRAVSILGTCARCGEHCKAIPSKILDESTDDIEEGDL
jgi:hypothetical protein